VVAALISDSLSYNLASFRYTKSKFAYGKRDFIDWDGQTGIFLIQTVKSIGANLSLK